MSISIKGKRICVTGAIDGFKRAELPQLAEEYGFVLVDNVTANTDILVSGKQKAGVSTTTKMQEAVKRGIKIWSQEDFLMMLDEDRRIGMPEPKKIEQPKTAVSAKQRADHYANDPEAGMF